MKDVTETIQISSNITGGCEICRGTGKISPQEMSSTDVAPRINHYIKAHGYRLLHVGTETHPNANDGSAWHSTVAVLGR
jgi:hypothetical protein